MKAYPFLLRLVALPLLALAFGCSPIYYSPNTHQVPMLTKKGDFNLGFAANDNRLEGQAAYAVNNNWRLLLDAGFFFPADDEQGDGGDGQFLEMGVGYFKSLNERFVFETYGLAGYGGFENHFPSTVPGNPGTTGKITGNFFRMGFQPSIGFTSKFFDAAVSARLLSLNYFNLGGNLVFNGEDQVAYLKEENGHLLFEPALTLRGGYDFIKLQIQLGLSTNLTTSDFRQDEGHLTIGLVYSLR